MNARDILTAARAKITNRVSWVQGWDAQDGGGFEAPPTSGIACAWCSNGAIASVDGPMPESKKARAYLASAMGNAYRHPEQSIVAFNDTKTHTEVLAAFDRAIKAAEAESSRATPGEG